MLGCGFLSHGQGVSTSRPLKASSDAYLYVRHNTSVSSSREGPSAPQIACAEKGNPLSENSIINLIAVPGLALPPLGPHAKHVAQRQSKGTWTPSLRNGRRQIAEFGKSSPNGGNTPAK